MGPGQEDSQSLLERGKEGVNSCRVEAAGGDGVEQGWAWQVH